MKKSNRMGYKGQSWKELQKIINKGHSRDKVFHDWLDLILTSSLALRDNVRRGNLKPGKFDGVYEDRYHEIIQRYDNSSKHGERPVDHFARAYAFLLQEINETENDVLGDIYMLEITYGEHGQFFTPESITDMMAGLIVAPSKSEEGRQVICDPACGSGRMLLSAHKQKPDAFLVGIDLDPRCAKMCTINIMLRELSGDIYQGNALTADMQHVWLIRNGWIEENENPTAPDRIKKYAQQQESPLAA